MRSERLMIFRCASGKGDLSHKKNEMYKECNDKFKVNQFDLKRESFGVVHTKLKKHRKLEIFFHWLRLASLLVVLYLIYFALRMIFFSFSFISFRLLKSNVSNLCCLKRKIKTCDHYSHALWIIKSVKIEICCCWLRWVRCTCVRDIIRNKLKMSYFYTSSALI